MGYDWPSYSTLNGLRPEDMDLLMKALDNYAGVVDDLDTLEKIEELKKLVLRNLGGKSQVFGM